MATEIDGTIFWRCAAIGICVICILSSAIPAIQTSVLHVIGLMLGISGVLINAFLLGREL